ncbi:MAG: hypothetical protein COB12_09650, partial [Flavobacterium sp.]
LHTPVIVQGVYCNQNSNRVIYKINGQFPEYGSYVIASLKASKIIGLTFENANGHIANSQLSELVFNKPNQTKPNQTKRNETKRNEIK